MNILKQLINLYESSEDISIDEIFNTCFRNDSACRKYSKQEIIALKRQFHEYVRTAEELRNIQNRINLRPQRQIDNQYRQRYNTILAANSILQKDNRPHKRYVQAFINNISVPKTLEELYNHYLKGNDAQNLVKEIVTEGSTEWTVPKWAKRGDIVFFYACKDGKVCPY